MTGLLLIAAMIGQQCPGGSCARPVDPPVRTRIESNEPQWRDYAVRVVVDRGQSQSLGSGTIVGTGETGERLILTARHVLGQAREGISVRHRNASYPARFLATGTEGDIAAVAANIPGSFPDLRLAGAAPSRSIMIGFGSNGRLHKHEGRLTGYATPRGDSSPDHAFSFGAESGDSGGGIFNEQGEFAGVLWGSSGASGAMGVSTAKVHRFLNVTLTDQTPGTPGSRGKIVTFSPFFFKIKKWDNAPNVVQVEPSTPPSSPPAAVTPPPVPAVAGPVGPQGPVGPIGPAGKDAPAADLSAVLSRLAALETAAQKQAGISEKLTNAITRPITFNVVKSDGTTSTAPAQLGSTVNIDVADKAIVSRLAALEAKLASSTQGK